MKILVRKWVKFVSAPLFCISKLFGYFYQRKIIHNIVMCVTKLTKSCIFFYPLLI